MRPHLSIIFVVVAALCLSGCGRREAVAPAPVVKKVPVRLVSMPVDFKKIRPEEAGVVPILEYHDIVKTLKIKGYQYPAAFFTQDLEWLYAHNYRPMSLTDYVHGKIDVPAGMSPVIITFDDSTRGQFAYLPDGTIDPQCAVGILNAFHTKHSDWALRGTFFILPSGDRVMPPAFFQKASEAKKLRYLVDEGFEIGNHTMHHSFGLRHWADARVIAEFAGAADDIHKLLPGYDVDTLALPYGVYPKNKKLVIQGASDGHSYRNICALLAGANPAPSPMSVKFKPYLIPRMIPGSGPFTIRWWLAKMERDGTKFVSDGDPNTFTIPVSAKARVNAAHVKNAHYLLRVYSLTTPENVKPVKKAVVKKLL